MEYNFVDLIDVEKVQTLSDSFSQVTGIANAIIDLEGEIITGSGWQRICTDFHREHAEACKRCIESDTTLANRMLQGERYAVYECMNGLVDAAAPILIEGEHVANFFTGQFLFEEPNTDLFRQQAEKFGFDEEDYMAALDEVPIVPRERIGPIMDFLSRLAELVGEMGLSQMRQLKVSQEIIETQQQALKELSTPVIPIIDAPGGGGGVIVMPLIGSIDTMRARDITRRLLAGIRQHRAKVVILDITGVPVVDSGVANHLNKTIQAARLKGARTIVTGISDAVAETIVDLGIDWSGIETLADLQTGLIVALNSLGLKLTR